VEPWSSGALILGTLGLVLGLLGLLPGTRRKHSTSQSQPPRIVATVVEPRASGKLNTDSKLLRFYLRACGSFSAYTFGVLCGWSREHRSFLSSGFICRGCHQVLLTNSMMADTRCYDAENRLIPMLQARSSGKYFECPKCYHRWHTRTPASSDTEAIPPSPNAPPPVLRNW